MRFKNGDRVRSIYACEQENVGTVKIIDQEYCVIYDNEPETEYLILDDNYLEPEKEHAPK